MSETPEATSEATPTTPEATPLEKELTSQASTTPQTPTIEEETPKVEETPKAEETPKEEAPKAEAAPEGLTVDSVLESVELPEGFELNKDDPLMQEFVSLLNDPEATKADLGAKLVGLYTKAYQSNVQQWLATQEQWQEEIKNDPNIGGDKLDPALGKIDELIRGYASTFETDAAKIDEDLRGQLDLTGAGNNPHIIRFLHWIASQHSEGAPLSGDSAGSELSRAERMFGT